MKIIEPSAVLIDTVDAEDIYRKLERCGLISHLSEPNDVHSFLRNYSAGAPAGIAVAICLSDEEE